MIDVKAPEECIYCKEIFTGNCNESIGKAELKFVGVDDPFLYVDLFINDDQIEVFGDTANDTIAFKILKKINYCPICGRKLEKESQ